jgi:spore germination protein YaaH
MTTRSRLAAVCLSLLLLVAALPASAADPSGAPTPVPTPDPGADGSVPSVHAEMLEEHASDAPAAASGLKPVPLSAAGVQGDVESLDGSAPSNGTKGLPNGLFREVFGYLPYWEVSASDLQYLDYSLVSTIAYFSVGAGSDGTLAPTTGWTWWNSSTMTKVINAAHARDVKVALTITMMAWGSDYTGMSTLLNSATNRTRLVAAISSTVKSRNADGVNLDFEPVPASLRAQYTAFVRQLKAKLVADGAGSQLTVATTAGAGTWSTGYDLAGLTAPGAADALMVMAYDLNWSGSTRAGGVAPIKSPYVLDVTDALNAYLAIVPASKLIWGVPYYGRAWPTTSNALNATTRAQTSTSTSTAWSYLVGRDFSSRYGRKWDAAGQVPWFAFKDAAGGWREGYYDDVQSLTAKYDLVNTRGLRGIGIWHLLMDGSRRELWEALDANFQGVWYEDILSSAFRNDILWLGEAGITSGCAVERFCPRVIVTRAQMASFLARAEDLPAATRDWYTDDATSQHQDNINRIADADITHGCAPKRFCPDGSVTRGQMASFLARALDLPATTRDWFDDDDGSLHEGAINRLAEAGITAGCEASSFCPNTRVTREQMAAFLHRSYAP